jgi:hypothetical protein
MFREFLAGIESVDFKKDDLLVLLFEYSLQRSLIKAD